MLQALWWLLLASWALSWFLERLHWAGGVASCSDKALVLTWQLLWHSGSLSIRCVDSWVSCRSWQDGMDSTLQCESWSFLGLPDFLATRFLSSVVCWCRSIIPTNAELNVAKRSPCGSTQLMTNWAVLVPMLLAAKGGTTNFNRCWWLVRIRSNALSNFKQFCSLQYFNVSCMNLFHVDAGLWHWPAGSSWPRFCLPITRFERRRHPICLCRSLNLVSVMTFTEP